MPETQTSPLEYFLHPPEIVRLMENGDTIPSSLDIGFDMLGKLDRNWIWVAARGTGIVGALVASPCHGAAAIWRIAVTEDASCACALKLLRSFVRDIRKRGFCGYLTLVQPEQWHLADIMRKNGAVSHGEYVLLASPLPEVK